jgi:FkbM family methyltransferase
MDKVNVLNFEMHVPKSNTDGIFKRLRSEGIWEKDITKFMVNNFNDIDTFIDIGANIGYYTLLSKSNGVNRCYSFEPNDNNFILLEKNINLNKYKNCFTYNAGLGSSNGTMSFNYNNVKSGHGSFLKEIKNKQNLNKEESKKIFTLDSINVLGDSIGIKLDVEGFELEVLKGMPQLLRENKIKFITIEISRKFYGKKIELEIIKILKENFNKLLIVETGEELNDLPEKTQYNIFAKKIK